MHLTDLETIKYLAKKLNVTPSKQYGQHFLIDQDALDAMVEAAGIRSHENVLEIGPGFGVLTQELSEKEAYVVAVEQDRVLAKHIQDTYSENVQVEQESILDISNESIADLFKKNTKVSGSSYRIIANVPYSITGALFKKFVSNTSPKPKEMVILVQKEVAQRVCAKPGNLSLVALSVQLYGDPEYLFTVPKDAFWPIPKIDSAVLRIRNIQEEPKYTIADIQAFWRIVRIGFSSPRKQVHNNLVAGLGSEHKEKITSALQELDITEKARAQEISVEQWVNLVTLLQ